MVVTSWKYGRNNRPLSYQQVATNYFPGVTPMPVEALAAALVFVGMFMAWAVLPSFLRKRHTSRAEEKASE
jgi:hypothetical protein